MSARICVPPTISDPSIQLRNRPSEPEALTYFTKALARAQSETQVRSFLKSECITQNSNGENELLYLTVKDKIVKDTLSFAKILHAYRDTSVLNEPISFFEEVVLSYDPSLTLAIYGGDDESEIDDWNAATEVPEVFLLPMDWQDQDSLIVFDSQLNTRHIDTYSEPNTPFIGVTSSIWFEVVNLNTGEMLGGNSVTEELGMSSVSVCSEIFDALENGGFDGILISILGVDFALLGLDDLALLYCENCDASWIGCEDLNVGTGDEDCDRDEREELEQLVKYNFQSAYTLRNTCHWIRSHCEFQIDNIVAVEPSSPQATQLMKTDIAKRYWLKGWKGRSWTPENDLYFFRWNPEDMSHNMKYIWHWRNPKKGEKRELNVGLSANIGPATVDVGTKIIIEEEDKSLGEDLVYYCDPANKKGSQYWTGSVQFFIKEHEPE